MEKQIAWLTDPNRVYDQGVQLLKEVFKNRNVIDVLERKNRPEAYLWEKLEYELNRITGRLAVARTVDEIHKPVIAPITITKPDANPTETPTSTKPKFVNNPLIDVSNLPEDLKAVYCRAMDLFNLMAPLHESLKTAQSDEERKPIVQELTSLEDEQIICWEKLDQWAANNGAEKPSEVSSVPEAREPTLKELKDRLRIVRDNITRASKEMKAAKTDKTKVARQKSIDGWEIEKAELQAKIDSFGK